MFMMRKLIDYISRKFRHGDGKLKRIDSSCPEITYVGRVEHDETGAVRFCLPGVQIQTEFVGCYVAMEVTPRSGYFMIEIDDRAPYKIKCHSNEGITEIESDLPRRRHKLCITYCNEGEKGVVVFRGLLFDSRGKIKKNREIPRRKIEFIGDSITCGYGVEDFSEEKYMPCQEVNNAYYSFALQTARRLKSQCLLTARSGICLHYDRYLVGGGIFHNLRTCYPYTLFTKKDDAELWKFDKNVPDVVCINLGTNDSAMPKFDKEELTDAFIEFVRETRSRYGNAKIVLLSGPMCTGEHLENILYVLNKTQKIIKEGGETNVFRFDFTPADGSLGYGTCHHPSLKQHTKMADELTSYLRTLMHW